ncbi:MAG: hypothetical protein Kow00104_12900 [Rhodothalassiaceae bacterium]
MTYRLGIDLGTNSLGWCLLARDADGRPSGIIDAGVRIYSDGRKPKDEQSLAVARRMARSMRRRRDRYLRRRRNLLRALIAAGLMPADPKASKALESLDPFALRARGLDEKLSPHEFGRALFHLSQRRGFKSNRLTDGAEEDESGKVKAGVARLEAMIEEKGARTLGEYYHLMRSEAADASHVPSIRARLRKLAPDDKQPSYPFYPSRDLVAAEFEALWQAQAKSHPGLLTPELHDRLHHIIFYQRPLKKPVVGRCLYNPQEERLPRAHPLFQRFRILQELNNLRIIDRLDSRPLRREERDRLFEELLRSNDMKWTQMRKLLGLPVRMHFNFEGENRKGLDGDLTAYRIEQDRKSKGVVRPGMGKRWRALDDSRKAELVRHLLDAAEPDELIAWLMAEHDLPEDVARALSDVQLPDGHSTLGETAMRAITEEMEENYLRYDEAVVAAGYCHHSDRGCKGELLSELPYYAEILTSDVIPGNGDPEDGNIESRLGRLTNPTVHIGLNQIRRLVNLLIARHGRPAMIVVELGRELKQNKKDREAAQKAQRENAARNDRARALFAEVGAYDTGENRMRYRLWKEQGEVCPYTGEVISARALFSAEYEIDHILPFSRTLDNSAANKVIARAEANREKRDRSPYEAWGHLPIWETIEAEARKLPKGKRWRFAANAMHRFEKEERDFLDRQLTETRYLGRLAHDYLKAVCPQVWVTTGQLTALVRGKLGLNDLLAGHNLPEVEGGASKNREDHRHHAIDAFVVGLMDRGFLNRAARDSGRYEREEARERIIVPEPFPLYREHLRAVLERLVVSHRPDHGTAGQMHNDTAYGLVREDKGGKWLVVTRKPIDSFEKAANLDKIRDDRIRNDLLERTFGLSGKDFKLEIERYARETGTRRLRIVEPLSVIIMKDREGRPYKAYKGDANHRIEIWRLPDGKWTSVIVSMFEANAMKDKGATRPHPAAKLVMRLHKNDMIAIEENGARRMLRVVQVSGAKIIMADHREGGNLRERDRDPQDTFKYFTRSASALQKLKARKLRILEDGRVYDPGPLEGRGA